MKKEGGEPLRIAILTVSDGCSRGEREDRSGDSIVEWCGSEGHRLAFRATVPDQTEAIVPLLLRWADGGDVDVIITTGGTGFGPRDVTPEATLGVIDREVPGIAEAMRSATFGLIPFGMLSRGVAGLRGSCLIVNLPGSSKAVEEGLDVIGPSLLHGVEVATGEFGDHR